jgi:hypothetical protein
MLLPQGRRDLSAWFCSDSLLLSIYHLHAAKQSTPHAARVFCTFFCVTLRQAGMGLDAYYHSPMRSWVPVIRVIHAHGQRLLKGRVILKGLKPSEVKCRTRTWVHKIMALVLV